MAVTSCCRALRSRTDVAASSVLWEVVESDAQWHPRPCWLARRTTAIQRLSLSSRRLCGDLAFTLLRMTSLRHLALRGCGLLSLPPQITALQCLESLDVSDNMGLSNTFYFNGGLHQLPLRSLTALTRLNLSRTRLGVVPAELPCLPHLADLDLSRSLEVREGGERPLSPLAIMSALTRLVLSRGDVPKRRLPDPIPALMAAGVLEWHY